MSIRTTPTTLADLRAAPELAVLEILDHAGDAAALAIRSQHPSVADTTAPPGPRTLRRARALLRALRLLRRDVAAYRDAVVDVIRPARDGNDDLPF